jgi:N-formylglutamate amidohydrolase
MEGPPEPRSAAQPLIDVLAPRRQNLAVVLASPHSGTEYPADLVEASRLDRHRLRRSEDSFVDEIFAAAAAQGAPLLRARFARAYVDPNREPYELDPAMFEDPLPAFANTRSPRVQMGLGTIARVVSSGEEIYARKLQVAEAMDRIDGLWQPYHRALRQLLDATYGRFGRYLLVDCHSMPSASGPQERHNRKRVDIVLGDCHGTTCDGRFIGAAKAFLAERGYSIALNIPYSGGFTTAHYGHPREGKHAFQIEINRALYMDERTMRRKPFIARLSEDMRALVATLAGLELEAAAAE